MNYIVISPYYPHNFQKFSIELKNQGFNVLGIGEEPYDQLDDRLKDALTEYFRVNSLDDVEEVKRAVAFLFHKHGPIDRIESQNEHWMELDAALRTQFNVYGLKERDLKKTKHKSEMKKYFEKAGVPVVPGFLVKKEKDIDKGVKKLKLPLIAKPDNGVGANNTYKLLSKKDVENFKKQWTQEVVYFIESYVDNGILCTYDGLIDSKGKVVFETSFYYTKPTLDLLNDSLDYGNIIPKEIDPKLKEYGRKIVKEFGMKERFFHIEFFKLPSNDYIALEYNNRIAGGYTIDLYNHTYECDLFEMYADVVVGNEPKKVQNNYNGIALSRRDKYIYKYTNEDIYNKYSKEIRLVDRVPAVFATAMGEWMYILVDENIENISDMMNYIHEKYE